jgi:DNA-binding beta-propeller fold protein YncE
MKRFLWLGFVLCLYLICSGCGDTFRPIIVPNPPTFPNPKAAHTVVSINDNGTVVPGSAMVVDVSGDSDVSVKDVGVAPVHAVQQTASEVLVVNHSTPGPLNQGDSITKLNFNGTVISSTTTISLPANSEPNFVAVAPSATTAYVTLPNYSPPSVDVVNTQSNTTATVPVGSNPVALAVTPNNSKLYVANQGDSTISGFNIVTLGLSPRVGSPVHTSSPPIWLVARTDNQRVYALEQVTGVLAELDTTSTAGPDPLAEYPSTFSVPGATMMVYDSNKNRLYIPGGPVMKIVDVSQTPAQLLATISIPNVPGLPTAVSASALAVTALPDGSRAYVASIPSSAQPSQASVSAVQGDGTTATYTYTWTGGHDLTPGITVAVSGITSPNDGFNGTYAITAVTGSSCNQPVQVCTFQAANSTVLGTQTQVTGLASSTIDNLFPQVSVVNVSSNSITKTFGIPGFPDATNPNTPVYYSPVCAPPTTYRATFRFMMAAGGDSSRAYLATCDGGNVNIIDTTSDSYILNLPAPVGTRPPIPPNPQNPPQNPVFLFAGP